MRAVECSPQLAASFLASVLSKANPGGAMDMATLLRGRCFAVLDEQENAVGAYVLRGQGAEVWVQAAAGRADIDLCDLFDELIAKHGAGFASIGFRTYRRGLARKAVKRGYELVGVEDGYILRKNLQ